MTIGQMVADAACEMKMDGVLITSSFLASETIT
jgi:hypothetical protein